MWFGIPYEPPYLASHSYSVVTVQDDNVSAGLKLCMRIRMGIPDGGDKLERISAPDKKVPSRSETDDQLWGEHDSFHRLLWNVGQGMVKGCYNLLCGTIDHLHNIVLRLCLFLDRITLTPPSPTCESPHTKRCWSTSKLFL